MFTFVSPFLRFQCLCVRGFNVSKRHFTFVRVAQSRGFVKRNVETLAWFADAWFQKSSPLQKKWATTPNVGDVHIQTYLILLRAT